MDKSEDESNELTVDVPEAELMEKSQYYFNVSASQLSITPAQP